MISLADLTSLAGTIISFALSWSPLYPFIKVCKKQEGIEIIPEAMLICNILTRLTFVVFNLQKKLYIPLLNSGNGLCISTGFACAYLYLYSGRSVAKGILLSFLLIFTQLSYFYLGYNYVDQEIVGKVVIVFNISMFIAPGQNIIKVIKTGNYKLIPMFTTIISALCTLCWFLYGVITFSYPYIIPNAIGLFFSVLNTSVWAYFYINREKYEKNENDNEEEKQIELQGQEN